MYNLCAQLYIYNTPH